MFITHPLNNESEENTMSGTNPEHIHLISSLVSSPIPLILLPCFPPTSHSHYAPIPPLYSVPDWGVEAHNVESTKVY